MMGTMNNTSELWISEGEAAVVLCMTSTGVSYVCESGRLTAKKISGLRHYKLSDVEALAAYRAVHVERRGRPSNKTRLERRLLQLQEVTA